MTDAAHRGTTPPANTPDAMSAHTPESRLFADVRLDNRDALRRELGVPSADDAELLVLAYQRWGTGAAGRLEGDFAFVLWDAAHGRMIAARDPFGVRPLFYRHDQGRLEFASDVETLLSSSPGALEIDPRMVADHLAGTARHRDATFFRGIRRLPPGYQLIAEAGRVRIERYWLPPSQELDVGPVEAAEAFREHFLEAVRTRLESPHPVVIQVSGGLDSSSIAVAARRIEPNPSRLRLTSVIYPGLACDERPFMDVVVAATGLPAERWDGIEPAEEVPMGIAMPANAWTAHGFDAAAHSVRRCEGSVVLAGLGGDELLFELGIFSDLAREGRWLRLFAEALRAPQYSVTPPWRFVSRAIGDTAPGLRSLYRRLRPRPEPACPPWWKGPLRDVVEEPGAADLVFTSATQEATWRALSSPGFAATIDEWQHEAALRGFEFRFPFLGTRLVRLVLSLPMRARLPGGRMKRLLRDAMAPDLPRPIAQRRQVTTFEPALRRHLERRLCVIRSTLCDSPEWDSETFVDRDSVRKLARSIDSSASDAVRLETMVTLARLESLESWLRFLKRRPLPPRAKEAHG